MKAKLKESWIEVGCLSPPRFKAHYRGYSSVWFDVLDEAWGWLCRTYESENPVDKPKTQGVKQP